MPYLKGKFPRLLALVMLVCSLLTGVAYLAWTQNSGTLIATSEPVSGSLPTLGTMAARPASGILTRQQTITFAPMALSPDMGPVKLSLKITQIGLAGKDGGYGQQTYTLARLPNHETVWEDTRTRLIDLPSSPKDDNPTLGIKSRTVTVGMVSVPDKASYVLTAAVEQWLLASPNLSLALEARIGTTAANPLYVAAIFATLFASLFLLYLTTSPEQRAQAKRHGASSKR
jgi:hypothetical protein